MKQYCSAFSWSSFLKASPLFFFLFYFNSTTTKAQGVSTGNPSQTTFLITSNNPSSNFTVPYTSTGDFTGTWQVQLSDKDGVFSSDPNTNTIGTGDGTSPITAAIPAGTPCGSAYRVRVFNTNPLVFGTPNAANLTVKYTSSGNIVTLSPSEDQSVSYTGTGNSITASATYTSTYSWSYSKAGNTNSFVIPGATKQSYVVSGADFGGVGIYRLTATAVATTDCQVITGTSEYVTVQVKGVTANPAALVLDDTGVGRVSGPQNITVMGEGLTGNITVTPAEGFQIRETGSTAFSNTAIVLVPTNGSVNTLVVVRFKPTEVKHYSGYIEFTTTGFDPVSVAVSGNGIESAPLLTTKHANNITSTSFTTGGDIQSDGGSFITTKGVLWSNEQHPTFGSIQSGDYTSDGTGAANFVSSPKNLKQNTTYYVRAYATNSVGTFYAEQISVTTSPAAPTEQVSSISFPPNSITENSVNIAWKNGNGDGTLVKISLSKIISNPVNGTQYNWDPVYAHEGEQEVFFANNTSTSAIISGLRPNTQYWFKVYESNNNNFNIMYNTEGESYSVTTLAEEQPLPVELLSFTGKSNGRKVDLKWRTASEQNSSHFNVLRSADGKSFESIGRVTSAGNSSVLVSYEITDISPLQASNLYYALEQVDFDGTTTRSVVIVVARPMGIALASSVYPNPTMDILNIQNPSQVPLSDWFIMNTSGAVVLRQVSQSVETGLSTLNVASLRAGVYTISLIEGNAAKQTIRFVKL